MAAPETRSAAAWRSPEPESVGVVTSCRKLRGVSGLDDSRLSPLGGGFLASAVVISRELSFEDEPERLSEKIRQ